jgi:2-alkenal reductase
VDNDLAVIKVDAKVPGWAPLGDSAQLQPGDTVLAIGSALGDFHNTVTEGIVSALNRQIIETADDGSTHTLNDMIQTDAAINHGNSGGPLIDLNGYVVGINTAIVRTSDTNNSSPFGSIPGLGSVESGDQAEGLGFAIASRTVKSVAQRLLLRLPIAYLGVKAPTLSPQLASYLGVPIGAYVQVVEPGSPAAQAGLQPRDVILTVNGQRIDEAHSLTNLVRVHRPGDTVQLTVNRAGRTVLLKVTLAALPASLR